MIMGLPATERDELLATVAQRMTASNGERTSDTVSTPLELYNFQVTAGTAAGSAALEGTGTSSEMTDGASMGLEEEKVEKAKGTGDCRRGKLSWEVMRSGIEGPGQEVFQTSSECLSRLYL